VTARTYLRAERLSLIDLCPSDLRFTEFEPIVVEVQGCEWR
jgi:hypothetical protein